MTERVKLMDCAQVIGLVNDRILNGQFVRVLTPLVRKTLPTADGEVTADWYGIELMADPTVTGYLQPKNLKAVDYRAVHIHLFGTKSKDS